MYVYNFLWKLKVEGGMVKYKKLMVNLGMMIILYKKVIFVVKLKFLDFFKVGDLCIFGFWNGVFW